MRGFTLIETLLYSGLVVIILGITITASLTFTNASLRDKKRSEVVANERFVREKTDWLFSGLESNDVINPLTSGGTLDATLTSGQRIRLQLTGAALELVRDTNGDGAITAADTKSALTNQYVTVSDLTFTRETWNGQPTFVMTCHMA
ncbi:MAG TPA: type II secretion system protein, partial [Patescibacteria group bacterium]